MRSHSRGSPCKRCIESMETKIRDVRPLGVARRVGTPVGMKKLRGVVLNNQKTPTYGGYFLQSPIELVLVIIHFRPDIDRNVKQIRAQYAAEA